MSRLLRSAVACAIMFLKQQMLDLGLYDGGFRYHEDKHFRIRFQA